MKYSTNPHTQSTSTKQAQRAPPGAAPETADGLRCCCSFTTWLKKKKTLTEKHRKPLISGFKQVPGNV